VLGRPAQHDHEAAGPRARRPGRAYGAPTDVSGVAGFGIVTAELPAVVVGPSLPAPGSGAGVVVGPVSVRPGTSGTVSVGGDGVVWVPLPAGRDALRVAVVVAVDPALLFVLVDDAPLLAVGRR
jgi:hypothetical protein